ncbi:hypothetical protein AKJ16_DCAP22850 [Drosera capensis]
MDAYIAKDTSLGSRLKQKLKQSTCKDALLKKQELSTTFYEAKECSDDAHTGDYILSWVEKCLEHVGPDNVIQVVTDTASANMAAKEQLKIDRLSKARTLTVFIYTHHKTLAMMGRFTKKMEIIRPRTTRCATSYLTLLSLLEKKGPLRLMFSDDEWVRKCKLSKTHKGKKATAIVMNETWWSVDLESQVKIQEEELEIYKMGKDSHKKAKQVGVSRLRDLVYVRFNSNLHRKKRCTDEKNSFVSKDRSKASAWLLEDVASNEDEALPGLPWKLVELASGLNELLEPRRSSRVVGADSRARETRMDDVDEIVNSDDEIDEDEVKIDLGFSQDSDNRIDNLDLYDDN